ncbi:pyridoxal-dependent decarboxylase [Streptomyces violascens]|uniref:pyridoxal-dependent decarboxylase n=1 Tax=Streptomyces violascens TaxID=67381 RepID=UPI001CFDAFA4|nr:pyridoxal-dependent decarboxylase [Streptomyces violascens]
MHVDAAYGGPFRLTVYGRALFTSIELADSITLDPYKALFPPFGTGALIVRDGAGCATPTQVAAGYPPCPHTPRPTSSTPRPP